MTNAQLERMREYGISIRGCRDCHSGLYNPRNGLRFRPTAQNRTEFRQVDEKTVRFSGRLDRPLLRMVLMGLSPRKAPLSSDYDAQGSAQMPKWEHLHAERGLYARLRRIMHQLSSAFATHSRKSVRKPTDH